MNQALNNAKQCETIIYCINIYIIYIIFLKKLLFFLFFTLKCVFLENPCNKAVSLENDSTCCDSARRIMTPDKGEYLSTGICW